MTVIIAPNIKKQSSRIDIDGNVIDKRTHQILEPNRPEYVPTAQEVTALMQKAATAPTTPVETSLPQETVNTSTAKEIQLEIEKAEARLIELKELKAKKIEEMKAQLAELEK